MSGRAVAWMPIFLPTKSFGELMVLSSVMKANGWRCSAVPKALTGSPLERARIRAAIDATLPSVLEPPAVSEIGSMLGPPGSILSSIPRSLNQPFSRATKSPAYWALASQPRRMLMFSGFAADAAQGVKGRPSARVTTLARPMNARRESEPMIRVPFCRHGGARDTRSVLPRAAVSASQVWRMRTARLATSIEVSTPSFLKVSVTRLAATAHTLPPRRP